MLKNNIAELLNEQINRELYSAYMYLGISAWYEEQNLEGFANWYYIQSKEEMDHAMKIYHYLIDNGEKVSLSSIHRFDEVFETFDQPLKAGLKHEYYISESIDEIYSRCLEVKDYRTSIFLEWFIEEQVEEEKNAEKLVNQFEALASDNKLIYMMDLELAKRTYVQDVK